MEIDDDPKSPEPESSDSEELEDNENEKELADISFYKTQIEANELNYEAHLGLIKAFRTMGELEELRKARQAINKVYPLSPELWMEWLSDEQKICTTDEERQFIIHLFEKAVKEYVSVKVWVEYIMFMVGGGKIEATRTVCEDALTAVGVHMSEGILVWQTIILVEAQIFVSLEPASDEKASEEQRKRLQSLYRRQARVPLMDVDRKEFAAEAAQWFGGAVDPQVKRDSDNSHRKMREKLPFEEALMKAGDDTEKLEAYRKYIDFARKNDNPALIQSIYERTVTDLCLNAGIWEEYVRYAMEQFSFADYVILPVCARSQLNCPWSSALFDLHITAVQMFAETIGDEEEVKAKIRAALTKTLSSGVSNEVEITRIWMAFLVSFRRRMMPGEGAGGERGPKVAEFRHACREAMEFLEEKLGEEGDRECSVARFQARVEAALCADLEAARAVWNDHIMKRNNNFKLAHLWLEFINLERTYGTEKHCRKLFRRALERVWDEVETIGAAYQDFERDVGSLETTAEFEKRYRDRLLIVNHKRLDDAAKGESKRGQEKEKGRWAKTNEGGHNIPTKTSPKITPKTPHLKPDEEFQSTNASVSKGTKRSVCEVDIPPPGYKKALEAGEREAKKQKVSTPPPRDRQQQHGSFVDHDSALDHRTVFLSNMDFQATEDQVLAVLSGCGSVENFRFAKDFKGRSKGFGYLVFEDASSVARALERDRMPVGTRPLFVSRCNPKNRAPAFKFSAGIEKEKLFVRGLPFAMSEEEVKGAFEAGAGAPVKGIRLVTHRNGHSKGNCYLEFEDEATAAAVMQKMDGAVLGEHTISVVVSNPTGGKAGAGAVGRGDSPLPSFSAAAASSSSAAARPSGRQRPQLSLMPRALLRKPVVSVKTNQEESTSTTTSTNGSPKTPPKSNEEFRKMFLK